MYPIEEYFNRINVFTNPVLSPEGKYLAYVSSVTGSPQIWIGGVNKTGLLSYPRPLYQSHGAGPHVFAEAFLWRNEEELICLLDNEGDEQTYIEIFNLKSGERTAIPRAEESRDYLGFISSDKKWLYFSSNGQNPQAQGLYRYDFKTQKLEHLYQHEKFNAFWSAGIEYKGSYVFSLVSSNTRNELHLINPKTKKTKTLFCGEDSRMQPIALLPHHRLLVLTDHGQEYNSLAELDIKTRKIKYLTENSWDVEAALLSPDKKTLVMSKNVAGESRLSIHRWPSLKKRDVKTRFKGVVEKMSFSPDGKWILLVLTSASLPREYYKLSVKTGRIFRLTDNYTSRVPRESLVTPRLEAYKSEGKTIYSWLFLPQKAQRKSELPVIVWPHGGPQMQERPVYQSIFQYFVGRGYAIWAPNHTGSSGFGKTFVNAIEGKWGEADLPDMKNGVEWLKASGWIDPERMVIVGGSYGGYMTLRTLTKMPKDFRCGVDMFGVTNLLSFVGSGPPDWLAYIHKLVGDPKKDEAKLRAQSPIFEIENIECPVLVIQGEKDPRVVKAESDQVVEKLKKAGRTVEYLVFDDEGHGFLKFSNELKAYTQTAEFIGRYVGNNQ